ncbi:MAG TPA: hypothetical protein PLO37_23105 [Candidatus Hydrogenedentes bacterium]|nr:hypothetical protein [Candidatus Hydrogenedentota bacterium]HPG69748.1 hypothetical protein [Candidatus Hydrogenedentota bacterium]
MDGMDIVDAVDAVDAAAAAGFGVSTHADGVLFSRIRDGKTP